MDAIGLRNALNANAEKSWQEAKTCRIISSFLSMDNIKHEMLPKGGIIARKGAGKILLRSELDALSFGDRVLHACGHDVHSAALASALKELDDYVAVFQPSEEDWPSGAQYVLEKIDRFGAGIAVHVDPSIPLGKVGVVSGYAMGSVDLIRFEVIGKSAHTATPEEGVDAILISAELIQKIHKVSDSKPCSVVISIVNGGIKDNIVCDRVKLVGTSRALDESLRFDIKDTIGKICRELESSGARINFEFVPGGYPALYNDPMLAEKVHDVLIAEFGADNVAASEPRLGNDDFAFFSGKGPICMIRVGCGSGNLHTPEFRPPDAVVEICRRVFVACGKNLR